MTAIINPPAAPETKARAVMYAQSAGTARGFGVNLGIIYRQVGSPSGMAPDDWLQLARPMLLALVSYRKGLHNFLGTNEPHHYMTREPWWHVAKPTLDAVVAILGDDGGFEIGDLCVDPEAAAIYCMFVDFEGAGRKATTRGRAEHRAFTEKVGALANRELVQVVEPGPMRRWMIQPGEPATAIA